MTLTDLPNTPAGDPVSPTFPSAEPTPAGRRGVCTRVFLAAGMVLMLAGCELPSSLDELTKAPGGQTQAEPEPAVEGAPQDDLETAATRAGPTEPTETAKTEPTPETILAAQKLLASLGYEPGSLDGLDGPKTQGAVRRYQTDVGLPADGRVTNTLVEGLSESDRLQTDRTGGTGVAGKALPLYAAGDTFIYSDGRTETVTGIDGDQVRWQSNYGTVITAHRDFVLPAVRRETDLLSEQTTVDIGPGALWPLKAGREISFTAKTKVTHKVSPSPRSEFTSQWNASVDPPPQCHRLSRCRVQQLSAPLHSALQSPAPGALDAPGGGSPR